MVRRQPSRIIMKPIREITHLTGNQRFKIFIKENIAPLSIGFGIFLVVVLCVILWIHSFGSSEEQASYLLYKATRNLEASIAKYKQDKNSTDLQDAIDQLQYLQTEYLDSNAGSYSYIYLGHALVAKGELQKAVDSYNNFLLFGPQDKGLQNLVNQRIAFCNEEIGNNEEAIKSNRKVVPEDFNPKQPPPSLGDFSLFEIGRNYELMGEQGQAYSTYSQLQKLYPESLLKDQVMGRLSELEPQSELEEKTETGKPLEGTQSPIFHIAPPRAAPIKKK